MLQLTPWNEFLMSLILHVINTGLAVLKHTPKRNELFLINSDPCSVFLTQTVPITDSDTHTQKHIHTCTNWMRSRSLLLKSVTYHLLLTRSLQSTGGPYEGGEIMSALMEGENNGSELEALISEPNRTFVVILLIFSAPQQDRTITESRQKWPQRSYWIYLHCHGKEQRLAGLETTFATV